VGFYLGDQGRRRPILAEWTGVVADDRAIAAGRCPFRADLVALEDLIDRRISWCSAPEIRRQYRARDSRISSAVFFHTNGRGSSFR
jgi:hypothetical protein